MILRPVSLNDIPALADLGRETFCDTFAHLYSETDLSAFLKQVYSIEGVTQDVTHPNLLYRLAEDESGLIGFCKLALVSDYAEHSNAKRPMGLNQLYTATHRIGQGIGAALMEWAIAEARIRGNDAIQLSVYSENYGAQRFYRRYGFTKIADIEFWVGKQCDAEFCYELRLD